MNWFQIIFTGVVSLCFVSMGFALYSSQKLIKIQRVVIGQLWDRCSEFPVRLWELEGKHGTKPPTQPNKRPKGDDDDR